MFSVIFEVHPADGQKDAYLAHAKALRPELEGIDGFIDNERFASRTRPGWVLSHSTWRDEKSVIRWRTHAGHHLIQERGRFAVFSDYHLRVGEVTSDSHPPAGHAVREQRFDATEVGRAKLCTLVEVVPEPGQPSPADPADLWTSIGLGPEVPGLVGREVYDSIYTSGKVLALLSWSGPGASSALPPIEGAGFRTRSVRIIRDYGMFDRRESPQFYPPVSRMQDGSEAGKP
jgi:heme-degrading monooxygenase HmoA